MKKGGILIMVAMVTFSGLAVSQSPGVNQEPGSKAQEFAIRTKEDTVRALRNLYFRKHRGGATRGWMFGLLTGAVIINLATYEPQTVTYQGQNFEVSSSPEPIAFVFLGFAGIMGITGIVQSTNFNFENQKDQVKRYLDGEPLPDRIRLKLRERDFHNGGL